MMIFTKRTNKRLEKNVGENWKNKNKEYLKSIEKFLDLASNIKDEDLKRLLDRTEEQIDTLKRRRTYEESDLEKLFGVYFASLDAALQAINDWQGSWSDAVDRGNCSSECAEFTNQELAIYKKRFGEIPKEEIDKELFGVDDEAKEDDLPF